MPMSEKLFVTIIVIMKEWAHKGENKEVLHATL